MAEPSFLRAAFTAALLFAACTLPAAAEEPAHLVLGAGATGIWHHNSHVQHTAFITSAEYRAPLDLWRGVKPLAGALAAADGSAYAHAGFYRDFHVARRWVVTPHFSAGVYSHGNKNDIGGNRQFQTGVDLMRTLDSGWRMGATLRHLSNAGTRDCNPGIETLAFVVAMPLR